MNLRHLVSPFGMLIGIFFTIAILNFFIKYINKKYINKLNKNSVFKDFYKKFMKVIVKYHSIFGILSLIFLFLHFYAAYFSHRIKTTGIIAAVIMVLVVLLGVYGKNINKNMKAVWLKIHRVLAFVLLIAIVFHIL